MKTPGRILVRITPAQTRAYNWTYDVLDYDLDSSVFWIQEGIGFDYFLDLCDFPPDGVWVIEDVTGSYTRGDGWSTDDDEDWYFSGPRPAESREIEDERLKDSIR
jgi:hypothetical protein